MGSGTSKNGSDQVIGILAATGAWGAEAAVKGPMVGVEGIRTEMVE